MCWHADRWDNIDAPCDLLRRRREPRRTRRHGKPKHECKRPTPSCRLPRRNRRFLRHSTSKCSSRVITDALHRISLRPRLVFQRSRGVLQDPESADAPLLCAKSLPPHLVSLGILSSYNSVSPRSSRTALSTQISGHHFLHHGLKESFSRSGHLTAQQGNQRQSGAFPYMTRHTG